MACRGVVPTRPTVAARPAPEAPGFADGLGEIAVGAWSVGAAPRVAVAGNLDGDATATTPTPTTMATHATAAARRSDGRAGRGGMCRW